MQSLRIALAQIDAIVGDLAGNADLIATHTAKAAESGARMVVFPEMSLTGYPIEDLALRPSFQRATAQVLEGLAHRLDAAGFGNVVVIVGTLGVADDLPTNRAAVLRHGRVDATYDKHHLPNYGVFDEYRLFNPGNDPCVITIDGRTIALAICEDIWHDGSVVELLKGRSVDLLAVLNGSPFEEAKDNIRLAEARERAEELEAAVAYVNLVGGQDDIIFDGGSFIIDATGELVARSPQFVDDLLLWDLPAPGTEPTPAPIADDLVSDEEVYRALVTGLAAYVEKNRFKSVILGVSGGIDSALVATLAADAIGGDRVHGVSMPSRYSSDHSRDDAGDLMKRIGGHYRVVEINPMVTAFEDALHLEGVAAENLQARVRGTILMGLSNQEGHLVLAPGNKTELATGYSTIYGDAVGGYAPLKDVDKSRVWALARWRNNYAIDHDEVPPIPESSITKPPSAELSPGQVDQDSLPPYDLLDRLLHLYVEGRYGRSELVAAGFDIDTVDRVVALTDRAEWKRRQYPLGSKVTPLAFGRDRRLPVTTRWREQDQPLV